MSLNHSVTRRSRPVIAIDGSESIEGRALFTISSLAWSVDWLAAVELKMIDVSDDNVELALDVFRWKYGISIESIPPGRSSLSGSDLYVAVAFRSADHLRLNEARDAQLPTLLAIQFPQPEWFSAPILLRRSAAFNPRILAAHLRTVVSAWL
jgi:hypothetical protein